MTFWHPLKLMKRAFRDQSKEIIGPKRKNTVSFALDIVHKDGDKSSARNATGVTSKKGKKKFASLSDEELKKRIRVKQKKKKRRRASKCFVIVIFWTPHKGTIQRHYGLTSRNSTTK